MRAGFLPPTRQVGKVVSGIHDLRKRIPESRYCLAAIAAAAPIMKTAAVRFSAFSARGV